MPVNSLLNIQVDWIRSMAGGAEINPHSLEDFSIILQFFILNIRFAIIFGTVQCVFLLFLILFQSFSLFGSA